MKNYRDLLVWQKAHAVTLDVYKATRDWPKDELYGLTSQARRAAVSIGANLAEGSARWGTAEFHRFAQIALGACCALDDELLLAHDLGYISAERWRDFEDRLREIRAMLTALVRNLRPTSNV